MPPADTTLSVEPLFSASDPVSEDLTRARQSSKQHRFAALVDRLRLLPALKSLHDRGRRSLVVLAYHRVVPQTYLASNPLDLDLISATSEAFEQQMAYLRRCMNPVSLARVCQFLRGETDLPERAVAVTFDDGYRDTFTCAFPSLQRHRIPATVFVTTGNVESGHPFWFQSAAQLMRYLPPGAIGLQETQQSFPAGDSVAARRTSLRELQELLKGLPDTRRTTLMGEWSMRFAQVLAAGGFELTMPLSWEEITTMAAGGIEFGSHTVTHPNLVHVHDEDLNWELTESKRMLENRLQRGVETVAYPIGTAAAYDERVIRAARDAGFRLGLCYRTGVNWTQQLDRFEIRRQSVGLHTTESYFKALTHLPGWIG
ncbi:MAG: polysaccharide deacetylase family protein [Steroidobacteraceae bacterium]